MKKIDIEDDLYKYILNNIEAFGETPSQILRRLLQLPDKIVTAVDTSLQVSMTTENEMATVTKVTPAAIQIFAKTQVIPKTQEIPTTTANVSTASNHVSISVPHSNASLPEPLAHGIEALFASSAFQHEPVITNKFKMMLTAMYYEDRDAFIKAAKVAKGRSRDYLGENLTQLLASDNQEEVGLLIASKPRDIPYTPFWVVTNANTGRKRIILTQVMASMGYPHHIIERIKHEI